MAGNIDLIEPIGATDHVLGGQRAEVEVVEYGDFQCPTCKLAVSAVQMLLKHFEGRIRFAYRHFPIEDDHPLALCAAEAAECAGAQGKFWEMHQVFSTISHTSTARTWTATRRLSVSTCLGSGRNWMARAIGSASASRWKQRDAATCARHPGFCRPKNPGRLVR